ncbi:MAG: peptidase M22 [Clostridia bacterium]|nr:peptidase M22 [Clostridia bacterium]
MVKKAFIGIDTSNYTTSFAICDLEGNILKNYKILLPVKEGERGLRQSDAVFAHIKNLPLIAEKIREDSENYEILAIGHSAYPRDVEGSYMPCFLVGEALSDILASLYKVDNYKFSHQAGHIRASVYSANVNTDKSFIAFHVSGGTTEILHVISEKDSYKINLIGGSNDLHAGQAIDRIGVKMGLKFPCGPKIEKYAKENTAKIPNYNISVKDFNCNLSGLENIASDLFEKTGDIELVSAFVLDFISKTIEKLTVNLRNQYPNEQIIYAGGVMSNSIIQENIKSKFSNVYFAAPEFSSDNASGTALLTRTKFLNKEE